MKHAAKSDDAGLERLAWLMDRAFRIPGTQITFGLDGLIELIPGIGDMTATAIQGLLVLLICSRYPALPRSLIARMVLNVAIDGLVGTVPLVGDVFDVFFKANTRNVALLRQAGVQLERSGEVASRRHTWFLVLLGAALLLIAVLVLGAAFFFARLLYTSLKA